MVEQKRTQLFMMLVQQAGVGSLPMSHLGRDEFLGFMRKIEKSALEIGAPTVVYWSSRNCRWLLPDGGDYRKLTREAFCVSVFSEEREDKAEEFCFLVESRGLCLVLYGHRSDEHGPEVFQCVGSIDPDMVRRAFQMMLPVWQFLDLGETNRLEDARNNASSPTSSPKAAQDCRNEWPVVKIAAGGPRYMPDPDVQVEPLLPPPPGPGPSAGGSGGGGGGGAAAAQRPISFAETMRGLQGAATSANASPTFATDYTSFLDPDASYGEGVVEYLGGGEKISTTLAPPPVVENEDVTFVRAELPKNRPTKSKVDKRGLKELRNVWTTISEESRSVFPPDAQRIIRDIFGQLRHSNDHGAILQVAIEELTKVAFADRGLVWQVIGDQLTVTHEFSTSGHTPFVDTYLGSDESSSIISEFLSRFPDETGSGVIAIPDTKLDDGLYKKSRQLATLLELSNTHARLVAQLRCIGRFHGFLELQQSNPREWSEEDAALLQSVAETLSVVVQQSFDLRKREMDASEMKLINSISELFRESKGERMKGTLARSVELVADHMGFANAQIYLYSEDDRELLPQMPNSEHGEPVSLDDRDNPFVRQFCEGRGKVRMINVEYTRKGDAFFGHESALVVPLETEGETLGVLGLWKRAEGNDRAFRPGDDDKLAMTICNNMASIIRADQAIFKIRQDGMREQLINRVTQVIRQSPKEVDQILEELVQALQEYFNLTLSVVSLYDTNTTSFVKSKIAGDMASPTNIERQSIAEELFQDLREEFSNGNVLILDHSETEKRLKARNIDVPEEVNMVIIAPLIHRENLKAALALFSTSDKQFPPADMKMVVGLAERVAADLAHKELFEQVERQAVTDPMTGLYNRRYFGEQFSREIDRNQRFGHPFSYIIVDLDFLKKINDSLGHQFGDAAIKHIANVIKKCVRDVDTTARYGGEEFVVLLPETDVGGARVVAERMCQAIREEGVEGIGVVTASIGVATFPYDAQDRDKLTELADQALYLAKHRGRNQVCSVSDDLRPTLTERGEEALEVQKATMKAKAEEFASIDLKLIAEHGLLGILGAVIKMIEAKDAYSTDRSPRAADYAGKLAQALHLSREHSTIISLSAILNNIGKISIPEEILQKKEALTADELAVIRNSPSIGAKLLEPAKHLHRVASVVESYHEHWDGSGYPKGLKGEQIPLESRIIGLVDAYVAMTSDRPHRLAMTTKEAAAVLQSGAGKEWDPRLVKLFLSVLNKEGKT
jgi:diguanylate cyclase (GGDEF)-like protein